MWKFISTQYWWVCVVTGKYTAGGSLLVGTLEGNLLLSSQVEYVSTLDVIISFLDIYDQSMGSQNMATGRCWDPFTEFLGQNHSHNNTNNTKI